MEPMKIIGIAGPARVGKDTLASMLMNKVNRSSRISFADPIREFVSKATGIPVYAMIDGPMKEQALPEFGGKSPRQMMQTLGTEWGRNMIDTNLWITVARKRLERYVDAEPKARPELVVFPDIRFENEAAMIRDMGGTIVHLTRKDAPPVSDHASERGVVQQGEDERYSNDGSLLALDMFADLLIS